MQVSVEVSDGLERRMTVAVPMQEIDEKVNERLQKMRGEVNLKGFRPGKVPISVVRSRFDGPVRQEVIGEVINSTYADALKQEGLIPAGSPAVEPASDSAEGRFSYVAIFEVYPQVDLAPAETMSVDKPVAEVSEQDVSKMVDTLRGQHTEWAPVERPAQVGDRVTIDFTGTLEDGSEFSGSSAQGMEIELGKGRLIGGFEDQLIGANSGEERSVTVSFPEDYPNKELVAKTATFQVSVHKVEEGRLPEVDEDFVKRFGIEDGSVESFYDQVEKKMAKDLDAAVKARIKRQVLDALLEVNTIELPKALVQAEVEHLKRAAIERLNSGGSKKALPQLLSDELFIGDARRRVGLGLVVSEVAKQNELKADPERMRAYVEQLAEDYENPDEIIQWYYGDDERRTQLEMVVLEDAVIDWVMDRAQVTEKPMDFDSIMNDSGRDQKTG